MKETIRPKTEYGGGINWNPWHGCHKISAGCAHCYVYRADARHGKDASLVQKTNDFYLPVAHTRNGSYKIPSGGFFWTCFTSDFLLEDADCWRNEAWRMIRERSDCEFLFITKRITRFEKCIPDDWGEGYPNVSICCTVENQAKADERLPVFRDLPIRHKMIVCEPLLEAIDLSHYLGGWVERVTVGGESGDEARLCNYDWILEIRRQCIEADVPFRFKQTGAHFIKDGKRYQIKRAIQHAQARKANINTEKRWMHQDSGTYSET